MKELLRRAKYQAKSVSVRGQAVVRLVGAYGYDLRRYVRFSSTLGPFRSRANLAAKITERYHGIEKSLSLPDPQPGHSARVLEPLIRLVKRYLKSYGEDELTAAAIGALRAYYDFNIQYLGADEVPFGNEITRLVEAHASNAPGVSGTRVVTKDEIEAVVDGVSPEFFSSRHSVRVYSQDPVTDQEIEYAVGAARCAPAVCNRQFGRVRVWRDRESIDRLLKVQGGTRGFGDNIPALALVTVSLRSYWTADERNQGWIDGGLFSMNFIMGLHAQGLGSVALNWSKAPERDRLLRETLPELAPDEAVIMFIGFGHLPEQVRVASSPRISLEESP